MLVIIFVLSFLTFNLVTGQYCDVQSRKCFVCLPDWKQSIQINSKLVSDKFVEFKTVYPNLEQDIENKDQLISSTNSIKLDPKLLKCKFRIIENGKKLSMAQNSGFSEVKITTFDLDKNFYDVDEEISERYRFGQVKVREYAEDWVSGYGNITKVETPFELFGATALSLIVDSDSDDNNNDDDDDQVDQVQEQEIISDDLAFLVMPGPIAWIIVFSLMFLVLVIYAIEMSFCKNWMSKKQLKKHTEKHVRDQMMMARKNKLQRMRKGLHNYGRRLSMIGSASQKEKGWASDS